LLQPLLPDTYVIDTSALSNIDLRDDAEDVWRLIVTLIGQGRIVVCSQVLSELRSSSIYLRRLKPYEEALQAGDYGSDDPSFLQHVGRITHEYPGMSRPTGPKTRADPYVVALAERDRYVVVADETGRKRPNRKICGVCAKREIRCITLEEFVCAAGAEIAMEGK
jgi:predicted nucleic acid-binding protein